MGFLDQMTDKALLAKMLEYAKRFELTVASGKTPEGGDVCQAMNAEYLFREAKRRGLVDDNGKLTKKGKTVR